MLTGGRRPGLDIVTDEDPALVLESISTVPAALLTRDGR
jgi:hypothetical protein